MGEDGVSVERIGAGVSWNTNAQRYAKICLICFMVLHPEFATKIAEFLLQIGAVRLSPGAPFTWASGWQSPIYCDNRLTLSYPEIRSYILEALTLSVRAHFPDVEAIAGVATAGIPQGVLLADKLGLPFIYVRSAPKGHGMGNQIEGHVEAGTRVVVIEDLISTGGSSLKAVEALQTAGVQVVGMAAIFNYGFEVSRSAFAQAEIPLIWLCDPKYLVPKAEEKDYICSADVKMVHAFFADPAHWNHSKK